MTMRLAFLVCAASLALAPVLHAGQPQSWADPTRPAGLAAADSGAPAGTAPRPARAASAAATPAAPKLQSVQVGANGQASALVDGRLLQPGDVLGAARIVAIDAEGLTLRDAKGRTERLNLISTAIAKQAGGAERPVAALPGAPAPAGPVASLGREGQRP